MADAGNVVKVIVVGEGYELRQGEMPRPPPSAAAQGLPASSVQHLLDRHTASFSAQDWVDEEVPFSGRLFQRPWRIVLNSKEGRLGARSSFQQSTFGTRGHAGLAGGFRVPPIRGQAVVYDPAGRDLLKSEFLCVDDAISNIVMEAYAEEPMTGPRLDELAAECQEYVELNAGNY